jgi:ADP-ribosyl-[dinitrogen reductase] hydrolase
LTTTFVSDPRSRTGGVAAELHGLSLEQRAVGAYLGLAVGDALGATVEFMTPREIQRSVGLHDSIVGGGWLKLRPGSVTDDTAMSLALGQSILKHGEVDAQAVAEAFSEWMRGKPVDVGNTVRRGIVHFRCSGETNVPPSEHDAGNGACMRTLPVALATFGCGHAVIGEAVRTQAHVTHNNPLSDAATECAVAMVQRALAGDDRAALLDGPARALVAEFPQFAFDVGRQDDPSAYIVETMRAVLQGLAANECFEGCLVDVVNRGGDADTTGAITGMIAGALYGAPAIPQRWLRALDAEVRQACTDQALALVAAAQERERIRATGC